MPPLSLDDEAIEMLTFLARNIRQLKNVTEQMSILETNRRINADTLGYLPETHRSRLPSTTGRPIDRGHG